MSNTRWPSIVLSLLAGVALHAMLAHLFPALASQMLQPVGASEGYGARSMSPPYQLVVGGDTIQFGSGSYFLGSHATFRVNLFDVNTGSHGFFVRQVFGGTSPMTVTVGLIAERGSRDLTDDTVQPPRIYHSTYFQQWYMTENFPSRGGMYELPKHIKSIPNVTDQTQAIEVTIGARLKYKHACRLTRVLCTPPAMMDIEPFWVRAGHRITEHGPGGGRWEIPADLPTIDAPDWGGGDGYPVELQDGFHTTYPADWNRVHVSTYNHEFYYVSDSNRLDGPGECGTSPCSVNPPLTWEFSRDNITPWTLEREHDDPPVHVFKAVPIGDGMYVDPVPAGESRWDVCSGDLGISNTPCGLPFYVPTPTPQCEHCPPPASLNLDDETERWGPDMTPPLRWHLDEDTFEMSAPQGNPTPDATVWAARNPQPSEWRDAMAKAADHWNVAWFQTHGLFSLPHLLEETASASDADILVVGVDHYSWMAHYRRGWDDVYAVLDIFDTAAPGPPVCYDDSHTILIDCLTPVAIGTATATPTLLKHVIQERTVLRVHLQHTEPGSPPPAWVYSTGDTWQPRGPWTVPVEYVLAHELGHSLLGRDHQPATGCPNPPTPWPVMCSPGDGTIPITGTLTLDLDYPNATGTPMLPAALKCRMKYPPNWVTVTPDPNVPTKTPCPTVSP